MAFNDKVETAESLATMLRDSKGAVVVDCIRGLNVADISALRRKLREQDVDFRVAKNTLLRRAAEASNLTELGDLFVGPTAIATSTTDEVAPGQTDDRGGSGSENSSVYQGRDIRAPGNQRGPGKDHCRSSRPPRSCWLAPSGATQAPAAATLSVIQAAARQVLNAVAALQEQKEAA